MRWCNLHMSRQNEERGHIPQLSQLGKIHVSGQMPLLVFSPAINVRTSINKWNGNLGCPPGERKHFCLS